MRLAGYFGVFVPLALATPCIAGPHDFSPTFRDKAMQLCTGDAMRLCLAYLMDEGQTARCMQENRKQLSPECRGLVEQGIKIFRR